MKDKQLVTRIAAERVGLLLAMARSALAKGDVKLSKRYVRIAAEIKGHYKVKDKCFKREVCKRCRALLVPGLSCAVTVASSKRQIIYKCKWCGHENKIRY
jgi:RNase P subunit RPR2